MTTPDASYVATGWFSEYDSGGKSNKKRAPLGGQAVILLPDTKMVIPASTFLEATDLQTALMLQKGLKKEEKEKLFSKARKQQPQPLNAFQFGIMCELGGVSEWFKEHAWKACGRKASQVRILSPPPIHNKESWKLFF